MPVSDARRRDPGIVRANQLPGRQQVRAELRMAPGHTHVDWPDAELRQYGPDKSSSPISPELTVRPMHTQFECADSDHRYKCVVCFPLRRDPSLYPERVYLELHPADAACLHCQTSDKIHVRSRHGCVTVEAFVIPAVGRDQVFMPMHYPETNILPSPTVDSHSRQPSYKASDRKK